MQTALIVTECVFLFAAMLVSGRRTIRTIGSPKGIIQGALLFYGLIVGGTFLLSVVIPDLLILLGAKKHVVIDNFPEATCMAPVVLLGWFPAAVFAVLVRVISDIVPFIRRTNNGRGRNKVSPEWHFHKAQVKDR